MIVLSRISKSYKRRKVLSDISLQINPGEFVCVIGPSGAGKSTLIHLLAAAEDATSGKIEVDGVDLRSIPPLAMQLFRQRVGVVFQDYKLLSHYTVRENIALPLEVCGAPQSVIDKNVTALLKKMKLDKKADALPEELSGGEKTRTAIARAIVHSPMILLADEPTGNLDPDQSKDILKIFTDINKSGTTVVLATHDSELVDALQTRVVTIEDGAITRDSKGGYKKKELQEHDILTEQASVSKKDSGSGGKKVKITSVK